MNDEELRSILDQLTAQIGQLTLQVALGNARNKTLQDKLDALESPDEKA